MLAITNATIIDGTGHDPVENGRLLIDGERISTVGSQKRVEIPHGATVIDAQGGCVLPGPALRKLQPAAREQAEAAKKTNSISQLFYL
jgi:dihydroorotase-like cyclic amidohydrolase